MRPLVIASLLLQRDSNRLGDAVFSYLNIYIGFRDSPEGYQLESCIEKRWATVEQPLAMLAFSLDPRYRTFALKIGRQTALTSVDSLSSFAVFYWRKLIDDTPGTIRGDMALWLREQLKPEVSHTEFNTVQVLSICGSTLISYDSYLFGVLGILGLPSGSWVPSGHSGTRGAERLR